MQCLLNLLRPHERVWPSLRSPVHCVTSEVVSAPSELAQPGLLVPQQCNIKVTGKRFAHATGPLVNNVKLRTFSCGSPGQIFSRQVLGWTAQ